jgi:hypothetical protein
MQTAATVHATRARSDIRNPHRDPEWGHSAFFFNSSPRLLDSKDLSPSIEQLKKKAECPH